MLIRTLTIAMLITTLFSCGKDPVEMVILPPVLEMERVVTLPLRNNLEKKVSYTETTGLVSSASIEGDYLNISFVASPTATRLTGDGITFRIHKKHLPSAEKTYSYNTPAELIEHSRYTFSDHGQVTRIRIIDTDMGANFSGTLKIIGYNEVDHLVAGLFSIEVDDLQYDPTNLAVALPAPPEDRSNLKLTGHFANVRVK